MRAAMDFLTAQTGIRRFVVTGLCSGGDIAFQLGIKEPRVATSIMINPRTFLVHDLSLVDSYQNARWYQGSLLRKESWMKLLRGDVDVKRALRLVGPKVRDVVVKRAKRAVDTLMSARPGGGGAAAETRRETEVPKCLRVMTERGVDTFLLVAEHDPGVDYIDANYGSDMRSLTSLPGYRRVDLKGTDHTFTARWAQERVAEMITDHLKQRYLSSRAA
jgi:pimeloyl-ACP methyl ester carboxylesterase